MERMVRDQHNTQHGFHDGSQSAGQRALLNIFASHAVTYSFAWGRFLNCERIGDQTHVQEQDGTFSVLRCPEAEIIGDG